jgi:hypothetical protein
MTYSVDLRKKVVVFVRDGGGQTEAARHFDISLWCVRDGPAHQDLESQQKGVPRHRKLDKEALRAHVRDYPAALLRERAQYFGVRISSMGWALHMKVTRKKDVEGQGTRSGTTDGGSSQTAQHHCRTRGTGHRLYR